MIYRFATIVGALVGIYLLGFVILYIAGYRLYAFPTAAMQPTIQKDERVVGRLSEGYRTRIKRFDLAIYRTPQAPGAIYAKRVIGLPGERLSIDRNGVMVDGKKLDLPPAVNTDGLKLKPCDVTIPSDSVFVLGDFSSSSLDSRFLGPIPRKDVIGYLVFKK